MSFSDSSPSFDDNTAPPPSDSASYYGSSPSDTPAPAAQDFPSAPAIPSPDPVNPAATNTDYNSGDSNAVGGITVGEPINSATGNVFQVQRDFVGLGPFPIRFIRFYNSLMQASAFANTELGSHWRGSYDSAVSIISGQSVPTAVVVRPDGQSLAFTNPNGSQWVPQDSTVRAGLTSTTDASGNVLGWKYITADDVTETYGASGQLLSIANRAGLTQTLTYNTVGELASVTDPYGHQMLFAYNAQGQLVQATDPAGGVYRYAYDGNSNLISVTYPDQTIRQYLYETSAFPNALTGLIDEMGSRWVTWTYDGQGRAIGSVLAGGVQPVSITYNADGSSTVTDARGTVRRHSFLTMGSGALRPAATAVVSCSSCPNMTSGATYDANGVFVSGVDPNGSTTALSYNAGGLLVSRTEAVGTALARTVSISWHPVFRLPTQVTYPDRVIAFTYDAAGNRTSQTVTAGGVTRTWKYVYNAQGQLTQLTGPRTDVAQVWNFTYNAQGNLSSIQDPLGHVTQFPAYDSYGHPLSMIDPNGVTSSLTFDARGRLIGRKTAGRIWTYQRDAAGQLIGVTYPNGTTVALTYDSAHRLTDAVYSLGVHEHRTLSAAGDVSQVQLLDASNNVVHQQSATTDGLGRISAATDANGQTTRFSYDNLGHPLSSTDALGRTSSITYDALNRPVSVTDPLGNTTALQYNGHNLPVQVSAANGAVTQYQYDSFGELLQETSPDRGTSAITYTTAGLPATRTDARGVVASLSFDALNRLTQLAFSGNITSPPAWVQQLGASILSDNVSYTYDQGMGCINGVGRLCARQDQSGTERYAYDAFGELTQQTHIIFGFSYSTLYSYDAAGQLVQEIYPDGRTVSYARDALERISSLQATVNQVAAPILSAVQYRADGTAASLTFGNGLTETRSYDPVGRLVSQVVGSADSRSYGFDAVGNLTTKQTSAESDQFTYDALNRLTAEGRTQGGSTASNGFAYDSNGNRLSEARNAATTLLSYTPHSNRLIQVGSSALALDGAGNTTSDTNGTRKFYYSGAGRLQWISQNGLPIAGYLYSALGQRTGKLTLQGISLYHYDILGRLISETTIGSQPSRDYIWAGAVPVAQINHWVPIGSMLTLAHCSVGGDRMIDWVTYLHADGIGTPRVGTDLMQNVVWRDDGEAFGETLPNQAVPSGAYPVIVNLRNPGQYFDQETGLFYNVARYYNPQTGRYIGSDPIGLVGGLNTYAYVGNNPTNLLDSSGLLPGDCYPTQNLAGANAVNDINWQSIQSNTEYAGQVYRNADGTYSYTAAIPGTATASSPGPLMPNTVGVYHTHGANVPGYFGENFSPTDISYAITNGLFIPGFASYLGTPNGVIAAFAPQIPSIWNLPYPPSDGGTVPCGCGN